MVCTGVQALAGDLSIAPRAAPSRVPVPVILAIGAETHILGEAIKHARAGAMRLVVGDGISHLLQGIESLWLLIHKGLDAARAFEFDVRRHIHEYQRRRRQVGFTNSDEADTTTH